MRTSPSTAPLTWPLSPAPCHPDTYLAPRYVASLVAEKDVEERAKIAAEEVAREAAGDGVSGGAGGEASSSEPAEVDPVQWLAERGIHAPAARRGSAKQPNPSPPPAAAAAAGAAVPSPASAGVAKMKTVDEVKAEVRAAIEAEIARDGLGYAAVAIPDAAAAPVAAAADVPTNDAAADGSAVGIVALLGYRVYLRNEQWRVRWAGTGEAEDSWERWAVLDTDELRAQAEALRDAERKGD